MEIIAIEGLDKSGKHTQTKALAEYLRSIGYKVVTSEFHRYDTPTGELIRKWLRKEWEVDQHTIELIMAADKQAQQKWIKQLEEDGVDFLILDRYLGSQRVYSIANNMDPMWVIQLQKHMRKPNFEIFIDIDPAESMRRKGKHGENDRYESDLELLTNVRELFIELNHKDNIINGSKSVEDVSKQIRELVNKYV